jgi:hypothetical protein
MTLPNPDANDIGRYDETIAIPLSGAGGFSSVLNRGLESISAALTKFVRNKTVYTRAATSLASSGTLAAISLPTNVVGAHFTHASGVFTCQTAGLWRVSLTVNFDGNNTGERGVRLIGSGALGARVTILSAANTSVDFAVTTHFLGSFAIGDTVTAAAYQNSGGALDTDGEIIFERVL